MPINAVLDVQEESQLYPYSNAEPLSLEEAKQYMVVDYDDYDLLISSLITIARVSLEDYTGLSFVQKRLTVQLMNECGGIDIPYGPIPDTIDVSLITDFDGNVINPSTIKITGNQFKTLNSPCLPFIQLIYTAGYTSLPLPLLNAMKAQIFFLFDNRGERLSYGSSGVRVYDTKYICDAAIQLAKRFRRVFDFI